MSVPILYVGAPGVGKTATIRQKYNHCEILLLSSQTEEDLAGIPYRDGAYEKRTIPQYIQRLQNAEGTKCLFLDEIDKSRREVADTLLTLITHPQDFGIPEGTDIVAAANPPEWGGGDGLSLPMINRFSVVDFTPDFDSWASFIIGKYGQNDLVTSIIEKIRVQELPFLESNGEGLNWRMTSPRSIDNAIEVCLSNSENKVALVRGLVTANMASGIIQLLKNTIENDNKDVFSEAQQISRSIGSKQLRNVFRK